MSRAERLLALLELLRRHRRPVSGPALARELGISIRTLYRDLDSLRAQGAAIDGAPGLGYVLQPGFVLPPLMLTSDEIDALCLGLDWVHDRADPGLAASAANLRAKIEAVLPPEKARTMMSSTSLAGPPAHPLPDAVDLGAVRAAIRDHHVIEIVYRGETGQSTNRRIWPFMIGYFDSVRLIGAWCELRGGIRHFRTDRIGPVHFTRERYPARRQELMRQWRVEDGLTGD
ncbi:helix-turn-helix transcriptional regulator [Devosia nitrariae]|uniref:Transcriptional regulator n=1 Tax=Devosia nitrariae TaxID=2071872 RepID=A0ABQ5W0T8_9HYPH|nr:YafY family protein [Devosia nitrariae]GLQ53441.1 transcriptional regulator [Devosia nitrariae]